MYARDVEGQTLTFGVSGKLIMNALVMYDRETESLWSQFLGQAVRGKFAGTKLGFISALMTDWATWAELHPDTKALEKGGRAAARDPYMSYYNNAAAGIMGETVRDDRLYTKEFVVGLEKDGEAIAYPYHLLNETPVINDTFQEVPIVVVLVPGSGWGVVFHREVEGQILTFDVAEGGEEDSLVMVDKETGRKWLALTGEALEGGATNTPLNRFRSELTFWFAWKDYYPHTRVYGQQGGISSFPSGARSVANTSTKGGICPLVLLFKFSHYAEFRIQCQG